MRYCYAITLFYDGREPLIAAFAKRRNRDAYVAQNVDEDCGPMNYEGIRCIQRANPDHEWIAPFGIDEKGCVRG